MKKFQTTFQRFICKQVFEMQGLVGLSDLLAKDDRSSSLMENYDCGNITANEFRKAIYTIVVKMYTIMSVVSLY